MDYINIIDRNPEAFHDSNLAFIQRVCARGLNPNSPNYGGLSIFHRAVNIPFDNIRVINELIRAGADVNARTHLDCTPLHFAVAHRKYRVVKALIQSGASVNAKDFLGKTSLHYAVKPLLVNGPYIIQYFPDLKLVNYLLQLENIDFNAKDFNGDTPLMLAVHYRKMKIVEQLLQHNSEPNISNNAFKTPLHVAFSQPPSYSETLLLKRGASILSVDKNGETPLDILLKGNLTIRRLDRTIAILQTIAFYYIITNNLKKKIKSFPQLSHYFNKFCDEVDQMKSDFILDNVTMHDFCLDCFNLDDFKYQDEQIRNDFILDILMADVSWNHLQEKYFKHRQNQIYGPVVERLVRDIYPEYFSPIFDMIPTSFLFSKLEMAAKRKKAPQTKGEMKNLADLFALLDIIHLFSKHLSKVDFFSLIVAFSDVKDVHSMQNLYARIKFIFMSV